MPSTTHTKRRRLAALGLATITLASLSGVYATWTDSVSTEVQDISTGTGALTITGGALAVSTTSSVTDLVPGDSVTRDITIHNGASYDLANIALSIEDSSTDGLTSHPEGLMLSLERETNGAWAPVATTGNLGTVSGDIQGPAKTKGGTDHLRVTQTFVGPNDSKSLKGTAAHLTYTFTATQRTGAAATPVVAPVAGPAFTQSGPVVYTNAYEVTIPLNFSDTSLLINTGEGYAFTATVDGQPINGSGNGMWLMVDGPTTASAIFTGLSTGQHTLAFSAELSTGGYSSEFTIDLDNPHVAPEE